MYTQYDRTNINTRKLLFFLLEIVWETHSRRGSWKGHVEQEAIAKCRDFRDVTHRVLLYNKPGFSGVETMIIVFSVNCRLMGDS